LAVALEVQGPSRNLRAKLVLEAPDAGTLRVHASIQADTTSYDVRAELEHFDPHGFRLDLPSELSSV
jgi:hypothetical protein